MIVAGASDVDAVIQEFVEKEESAEEDIALWCASGATFGGAVGMVVALFGLMLGAFGNPVGTVIVSFMGVGAITGGLYAGIVKSGRQKKIALPGSEKQIIHKLIVARNEVDGRIKELEDKRHKLDRELAALTSDDFVEEFVRDKPFPAPTPVVPLLTPSIPDVSDEPDPDFMAWYHDSDCA